jgi:hypothetical protein
MSTKIDITSMIIFLSRILNLLRVSGKTEITISTFSREIPIRAAPFFLIQGADCMKFTAFSGFDGDSPIVSL